MLSCAVVWFDMMLMNTYCNAYPAAVLLFFWAAQKSIGLWLLCVVCGYLICCIIVLLYAAVHWMLVWSVAWSKTWMLCCCVFNVGFAWMLIECVWMPSHAAHVLLLCLNPKLMFRNSWLCLLLFMMSTCWWWWMLLIAWWVNIAECYAVLCWSSLCWCLNEMPLSCCT